MVNVAERSPAIESVSGQDCHHGDVAGCGQVHGAGGAGHEEVAGLEKCAQCFQGAAGIEDASVRKGESVKQRFVAGTGYDVYLVLFVFEQFICQGNEFVFRPASFGFLGIADEDSDAANPCLDGICRMGAVNEGLVDRKNHGGVGAWCTELCGQLELLLDHVFRVTWRDGDVICVPASEVGWGCLYFCACCIGQTKGSAGNAVEFDNPVIAGQPEPDEMQRPQPEFFQREDVEIINVRVVPCHDGVAVACHEVDACIRIRLAQGSDGRCC